MEKTNISDETVDKVATMISYALPSDEMYILGCQLWVNLKPTLGDYERLRKWFWEKERRTIVSTSKFKYVIELRAKEGSKARLDWNKVL